MQAFTEVFWIPNVVQSLDPAPSGAEPFSERITLLLHNEYNLAIEGASRQNLSGG
jgi:hypothetical protein